MANEDYEFAEIIYENGESSLAAMDQGEEAFLAGVKEHHRRAKNGEPIHNSWGPDERPIPATRISRVLVYKDHPGEPVARVSTEVAKKTLAQAVTAVSEMDDEVAGPAGTVDLYALSDKVLPRVLVEKEHPHDSEYIASEDREINASAWGGDK